MIIDELSNKKILLLQGPIGYFFRNLARDLKDVNASVYKGILGKIQSQLSNKENYLANTIDDIKSVKNFEKGRKRLINASSRYAPKYKII